MSSENLLNISSKHNTKISGNFKMSSKNNNTIKSCKYSDFFNKSSISKKKNLIISQKVSQWVEIKNVSYEEALKYIRESLNKTKNLTQLEVEKLKKYLNYHCCWFMQSVMDEMQLSKESWHIWTIVDQLINFTIKAKFGNLINSNLIAKFALNAPPRNYKSTIITNIFTSWLIAIDPKDKIIIASCDFKLAYEHIRNCREILELDFFRKNFNDATISCKNDAISNLKNDRRNSDFTENDQILEKNLKSTTINCKTALMTFNELDFSHLANNFTDHRGKKNSEGTVDYKNCDKKNLEDILKKQFIKHNRKNDHNNLLNCKKSFIDLISNWSSCCVKSINSCLNYLSDFCLNNKNFKNTIISCEKRLNNCKKSDRSAPDNPNCCKENLEIMNDFFDYKENNLCINEKSFKNATISCKNDQSNYEKKRSSSNSGDYKRNNLYINQKNVKNKTISCKKKLKNYEKIYKYSLNNYQKSLGVIKSLNNHQNYQMSNLYINEKNFKNATIGCKNDRSNHQGKKGDLSNSGNDKGNNLCIDKEDIKNKTISCKKRLINDKTRITNISGGTIIATSMSSGIIGRGANIIIIDDPHNYNDANSSKKMEKIVNFFKNTTYTRIDKSKNPCKSPGGIIVVMQRLHHQDLMNHIFNQSFGWSFLKLQLIQEKNEIFTIFNHKVCLKKGDILNPAQNSKQSVKDLIEFLGEEIFQTQYQQNPIMGSGAIIKEKMISRYNLEDFNKKQLLVEGDVVHSVDVATSADKNNYSVCTTWWIFQKNYYLLDVKREQLAYPDLLKLIYKQYNEFGGRVIVESSGCSAALIGELEKKMPIVKWQPKFSKVQRLKNVLPFFESKKVYLPTKKSVNMLNKKATNWLINLENELFNFPISKYDDQIDSISQFLSWVMYEEFNQINEYVRPQVLNL